MDAINQPLLDVRDLSVAFHQPSGATTAVDRISFSGMSISSRPLKWMLPEGCDAVG